MRHCPDGSYNWIGHYLDYWSKVHVLFLPMRKCAEEVTLSLVMKVLCYFGLPAFSSQTMAENWSMKTSAML